MLPMVNEADAMSAELDKKVKFELALVSPQARGLKGGKTEVKIRHTYITLKLLSENSVCTQSSDFN